MKMVLLEKPADGKARLVELLSEGGTGYYVHNNKGNENGAKGGKLFEASKAAIVFIEYQNEFTTEGQLEPNWRPAGCTSQTVPPSLSLPFRPRLVGGKLNGGVKGIMETTGMLSKSADVAEACRKAGVKVMHAAITFAEDASDNPNKALGILAGCAKDKLFTAGTWNAEFCKEMTPKEG